ncbi:MAG: peptidase [Fulvimarina manganoxydans]|uniref:phage major capsid protein n=1 Tax=Fulvimarina manganoxydans TaxID=937218 RepID=UPI0023577F83|nr:Mu-like prophage major head subunit gpT family protein [Fulvimarina manganoxydans]MCK5932916.1 peptidase [Fulvimarina manganoxydans]
MNFSATVPIATRSPTFPIVYDKLRSGEMLVRDSNLPLIERQDDRPLSSWNAEDRTLEVIASTGAGRPYQDGSGLFEERLDVAGVTVGEGIPFLDHHNRSSFDSILGHVVSTRIENGQLLATIKLSATNPTAQRLAQELTNGARYGISVGYEVTEWEERTEGGKRIKTAKSWTVREISLVGVAADAGAGTRSGPELTSRATAHAEIRILARQGGLPQDWVDRQIDAGASIEQARSAALDAMIQRGAMPGMMTRAQIGMDYTDPAIRARAMGEGLYTRIDRRHTPSVEARRYAGMGLLDLARDCLQTRSISTMGSATQIIQRALHTTSDFPLLLGDAVNRTVRANYELAGSALKVVGRQVNHSDFRMRHRLMLSEGPELEKLNESGEIRSGTLAEARESYKLDTYAKKLGISRQVLVNDDLGAFADIGRLMGQGAAATEAKLLVTLLVANAGAGPKLSDNKALFHIDHGNRNSDAAPWVSSEMSFVDLVAAGRLAMRRQVSLQGNPIAVSPKFLIVPSEGETEAEKLLATIAPASVDQANPFTNRLTLLVEPRLMSPTAWYLAADAAMIDGLEWSYLEGEEGPQIEAWSSQDVEGVQVKCRLDFGAGFVDWRGWYRNDGTE